MEIKVLVDSNKGTSEEVETLETMVECLAADIRTTVEVAEETLMVDLTISIISAACLNKCKAEVVVDSSTVVVLTGVEATTT